jgi:two-component sensor histidine kinase
MDRLARFDISRRYTRPATRHAVQALFGAVCAGVMIVVRSALDVWLANTGPFALVYPAVMVATLYGHWRAGVVAYLLAFTWAWYVVLPFSWSFHFASFDDLARTAINAVTTFVVLVLAEAFRLAAERSRAESRREIERQLVLLAELEHRTKNNFALVASLLEIQKRRQNVPGIAKALDDAIGRVRTFAEAYSNLAMEQQEGAEVAMKPYLDQLVDRVARASFHDGVRLEASIADMRLPREVGVGIGLYLNEALANCAKYAFADGRGGSVHVIFGPAGRGWRLVVEDDSGGPGPLDSDTAGLGTSLMAAFAQQARAEHLAEAGANGYRVKLFSADGA